jgi:eukaryotic-like serine/threonine-protein kinase
MTALDLRIRIATIRGQMKDARNFAQQLKDKRQSLHLTNQSNVDAYMAMNEALVGNRAEAESVAEAAVSESPTLDALGHTATTYAVLHEDQKAIALANQIEREYPNNTWAVNVTVPQIRAMVALRPSNSGKSDPAKALDLLNASAVYARGEGGMYFIRSLAYEEARRYPEAQQDLETVMGMRSHGGPDVLFLLAELEKGRVYQKQGNLPDARIAYQNVLADLRDADPDLPLLHEVKAEYAKIQ